MSLRNPFLWKDSQKSYLKEEVQKVNTVKQMDTEFMANTSIKLINDDIHSYKAKINNMESALAVSEAELKEKEKRFKEFQRQRAEKIKSATKSKLCLTANNKRILENDLDKNIKYMSTVVSQNQSTRGLIDSLRREKKTYQTIEQKITKEIETLKKNYESASAQLDDLVNNRLRLEEKMSMDNKTMEREEQLAATGLLTMQQKLANENKKVKWSFKRGGHPKEFIHAIDDNTTVRTDTVDNYTHMPPNNINKSSRKNIKTNTFIIKTENEKPKRGSTSAKRTVKAFDANRSDRGMVNEEYLAAKEAKIKQKCEHIKTLLSFIHRETHTNSLDELLAYYSDLEEENKEIYKETRAFMDEIDSLKDQKLAMLFEIKSIESCKGQKTNIKENIVEESKAKIAETQNRIEMLKGKCQTYKKIVSELKLSIPVILNKLILDEAENTFELHGSNNENIHHQLYSLERKSNYILKLVKDCNLEAFIFEANKDKIIPNKLDENKHRSDLAALDDLSSKLIRILHDGEERREEGCRLFCNINAQRARP